MYIKDKEVLRVQAFDGDGNRFSTLRGVPFDWSLADGSDQAGPGSLRVVPFTGSSYESADDDTLAMEAEGRRGAMVLVEALAPGNATIVATPMLGDGQSVSASVQLTVVEPVSLHPVDTVTVAPGTNYAFALHRIPQETPLALPSPSFAWTTSDSTVATVSQAGVVAAQALGEAEVRVTYTGAPSLTQSAVLRVSTPTRLGAFLVPADESLAAPWGVRRSLLEQARPVGGEAYVRTGVDVRLNLELFDRNGRLFDPTVVDQRTFTVDAGSLEVAEGGRVLRIPSTETRTTLTVSDDTGLRTELVLHVRQPVAPGLATVVLPAAPSSFDLGVTGGSGVYTYRMLDERVATVTDAGRVVAHSLGSTTLVIADTHNPTDVSNVTVAVVDSSTASLTLQPAARLVRVGESLSVAPIMVADGFGDVQLANVSSVPLTWNLGSTGVFELVGDGVVRAIRPGVDSIAVSRADGGPAAASVELTAFDRLVTEGPARLLLQPGASHRLALSGGRSPVATADDSSVVSVTTDDDGFVVSCTRVHPDPVRLVVSDEFDSFSVAVTCAEPGDLFLFPCDAPSVRIPDTYRVGNDQSLDLCLGGHDVSGASRFDAVAGDGRSLFPSSDGAIAVWTSATSLSLTSASGKARLGDTMTLLTVPHLRLSTNKSTVAIANAPDVSFTVTVTGGTGSYAIECPDESCVVDGASVTVTPRSARGTSFSMSVADALADRVPALSLAVTVANVSRVVFDAVDWLAVGERTDRHNVSVFSADGDRFDVLPPVSLSVENEGVLRVVQPGNAFVGQAPGSCTVSASVAGVSSAPDLVDVFDHLTVRGPSTIAVLRNAPVHLEVDGGLPDTKLTWTATGAGCSVNAVGAVTGTVVGECAVTVVDGKAGDSATVTIHIVERVESASVECQSALRLAVGGLLVCEVRGHASTSPVPLRPLSLPANLRVKWTVEPADALRSVDGASFTLSSEVVSGGLVYATLGGASGGSQLVTDPVRFFAKPTPQHPAIVRLVADAAPTCIGTRIRVLDGDDVVRVADDNCLAVQGRTGAAAVEVCDDDVSDCALVRVLVGKPAFLSLNGETEVPVGGEVRLVGVLRDEKGNPFTSCADVNFVGTCGGRIAASAAGCTVAVRGVTPGTCVLRAATVDGRFEYDATIVVRSILTPEQPVIHLGSTVPFAISNVVGLGGFVSDDPSIVDVDSTGQALGRAPGCTLVRHTPTSSFTTACVARVATVEIDGASAPSFLTNYNASEYRIRARFLADDGREISGRVNFTCNVGSVEGEYCVFKVAGHGSSNDRVEVVATVEYPKRAGRITGSLSLPFVPAFAFANAPSSHLMLHPPRTSFFLELVGSSPSLVVTVTHPDRLSVRQVSTGMYELRVSEPDGFFADERIEFFNFATGQRKELYLSYEPTPDPGLALPPGGGGGGAAAAAGDPFADDLALASVSRSGFSPLHAILLALLTLLAWIATKDSTTGRAPSSQPSHSLLRPRESIFAQHPLDNSTGSSTAEPRTPGGARVTGTGTLAASPSIFASPAAGSGPAARVATPTSARPTFASPLRRRALPSARARNLGTDL